MAPLEQVYDTPPADSCHSHPSLMQHRVWETVTDNADQCSTHVTQLRANIDADLKILFLILFFFRLPLDPSYTEQQSLFPSSVKEPLKILSNTPITSYSNNICDYENTVPIIQSDSDLS